MLLLTAANNIPKVKMCYLNTYVIEKDEETGKDMYRDAYNYYYNERPHYHRINLDPVENEIQENTYADYVKDKHYAYCFKCKKVVVLKEFSTFRLHTREDFTLSGAGRAIIHQCPCCGQTSAIEDMYKINVRYRSYLTHFLDDNKLKIKGKEIVFNFTSGNFFMRTYESLTTLNLDTGMAYEFPVKVNGVVPKKRRGKIINATYRTPTICGLNTLKYNKNTVRCDDALLAIFNTIRDYKMKKSGVYIPGFKDQAIEAMKTDSSIKLNDIFNYTERNIDWRTRSGWYLNYTIDTVFDSEIYKYGRLTQNLSITNLLLFNRFPYINVYRTSDVLAGGLCLDYGLREKEGKKLLKFIRSIKPDETNPIKKLCSDIGVSYSKKLRPFFNASVKNIYYYDLLIKSNLKKDNINKILDLKFTYDGKNCGNEIIDILRFIKSQKRIEGYNENNFVNKLCRDLSARESGRYYNHKMHLLNDYLNLFGRIQEIDPNYLLSFREYDIKELHDIASTDYNKLRKRNREIEYKELDYKLNGEFNNFKFEIAKDTHTLIDIGTKMHICVGGYDQRALEKRCTIVSVKDAEDNYVMCIELDKNYSVYQTKLMRNNTPNEGTVIEEGLLQWLTANKLVLNTHDIKDITKAKYYLANPDVHAKMDKERTYGYKSLDECRQIVKEYESREVAATNNQEEAEVNFF